MAHKRATSKISDISFAQNEKPGNLLEKGFSSFKSNVLVTPASSDLYTRIFWLIIIVGALLRFSTLGFQSLWLDEAVSFWHVNRSLSGLVELHTGTFRPLFFFLLYPLAKLGTQEWLLRLPSALAGIASVWIFYILARKLFDRTTALLAAAFLALAPLHLWYSQEARFYALVGLLSLSAAYFALRGLVHNRSHDWVLFGVFEALALLTESGAVWFVLAMNTSGILMARLLLSRLHPPGDALGPRLIYGWALSQMVGVTLYLPAMFNLASSMQGGSTSWIPSATIRELLRVIADFSGGFLQPVWYGILALLGVGLGLALGAFWMVREMPGRWRAYAMLLPWLVLPVTISFIISQPYIRPEKMEFLFGSRPSVFLTRNLITILFPLLLLLARGLVLMYQRPSRAWRWLGLGLASGILTLYALGYFGNHLVLRKEDYRSAAAIVVAAAGDDDLVLASPGYIEQPLAYYYYDREPEPGLSLDSVRDGVVDSQPARQDPDRLRQVEQNLFELIQQHDRIWFITNDNIFQKPDPALIDYLEQTARLEQYAEFEGMLVRLYVLPTAGATGP